MCKTSRILTQGQCHRLIHGSNLPLHRLTFHWYYNESYSDIHREYFMLSILSNYHSAHRWMFGETRWERRLLGRIWSSRSAQRNPPLNLNTVRGIYTSLLDENSSLYYNLSKNTIYDVKILLNLLSHTSPRD
jgi:hypothetical protein